MQVSELRRVVMKFRGSEHSTEHFMHHSQVETFLKACLELHYLPGKNPHNDGKTSEVWEIVSDQLSEPKAYWWSTPGLGIQRPPGSRKIEDSQGAEVSSFYVKHTRLWAHPLLIQQEKDQEEAENRAAEKMGW